jgi:Transposase DDE domain
VYASAKHGTFSHDEKLSHSIAQAPFLGSGKVFDPLEMQKTHKKEYALRAGVEGTISQAVAAFGLRRARYFGWLKTHLQHVLTATALNFVRVGEWLAGTPLAKTRKSAFVRLLEQPLAA